MDEADCTHPDGFTEPVFKLGYRGASEVLTHRCPRCGTWQLDFEDDVEDDDK